MPPSEIKRNITIGADPEVFLRDTQTGRIVSAHALLKGTKESPFPVDFGALQVDGVAAEFNILPASSRDHFSTYIQNVMKTMREHVGTRYELVMTPSVTFEREYWDTLPRDPKVLGCVPDWNAWTGSKNPTPQGDDTIRYAGGHVHGGWTKNKAPGNQDHVEDCMILAKEMDYCLGVFSLIWDADGTRRSLYGRAGTFRDKPYGIEYRSLSNRWLSSPYLINFVYTQTYNCISHLLGGGGLFADEYKTLAQEVIDGSVKWWDDLKHPLYQIGYKIGVDTQSLISGYLDPAWGGSKVESKSKEKANPKFMYKARG